MTRGLCPGQPGWGSEGRPARPGAGASAGLAATPAPPRRQVTLGTRRVAMAKGLEIPQQISGTGNEGSALGAKRTLSDWGCVHLQDLMDRQRTSWTSPGHGRARPRVCLLCAPAPHRGRIWIPIRIMTAALQSSGRAETASKGGPGAETSVPWFSSPKTHNSRKAKLGRSWWSSG